ncbi:MAG: cytochrome b/b6 domain-containing protein [Thiogranum sp.]|nr:cytochrome b/b6 domain-containing protein [Thiogranum sp.]
MHSAALRSFGRAAVIGLVAAISLWQLPAQTATAAETSGLDDATCLSCHAEGSPAIETTDEDDEVVELPPIRHDDYIKGVHSDMSCISCHSNITDAEVPHVYSDAEPPDCASCHQQAWETVKSRGLTEERARMGVVVEVIGAYENSFHARPAGKDKVKASCNDCHHTHYFNVPPQGTSKRTDWHLSIPNVCAECHEDALEDYADSVHGRQVLEEQNPRAAVCTDCHTSHDISKTTRDPFQLLVTRQCGSCHEQQLATYRDTYHGQINTLGYAYTAKCYDCHGSHDILEVDDPESMVHPDNRLETCEECHDGRDAAQATPSLLTFGPHAHGDDFESYPQMWIATRFMHALFLFVFAYFWAHSLLWWFREFKDSRGTTKRVRTEGLISGETGTHREVRRFGAIWRLGHLIFAISVMFLILTGMAVAYAHTAWAPVVIETLGGPEQAGLIHRISAAIMLGIFFLHLIGVGVNIFRKRKTFRWFGPDSLIPNWKDFKDAYGMFVWFVGKGPRPVFDRWTYWEKFDYWAVFWGMAVIGTSGMMLSFPETTASLFPGWVFNVVMLVHGEEAFLAAVFLFTVHFFNNHFRPDKLPPPDVVMFTGTQSLEEFQRDHGLQYQRLMESGELDKYLVDAPSRPMTIGSKILGLTLITVGLALLVVVAIGFFTE